MRTAMNMDGWARSEINEANSEGGWELLRAPSRRARDVLALISHCVAWVEARKKRSRASYGDGHGNKYSDGIDNATLSYIHSGRWRR